MIYKKFLLVIIVIGLVSNVFPQTLFRSGNFLHHSTGGVIWGNSNPSVPQLVNMYNSEKNFTSDSAVTLNIDEGFFPSINNGGNFYDVWHAVFVGESQYPEEDLALQQCIQNNRIVVIKACWGGSAIAPMGNPADTLVIDDNAVGSGGRTYYRTQWHWRSIVRIMQSHPDNFFVIWTGIPLVPGPSYNGTIAHNFFTWAKDTLATGNDPVFGDFPDNVYVFDAFHLLATPTENFSWGTAYWGMNPLYHDAGDNHPNVTGANVVAQPFVWETFNAAIAYEQLVIPVELTAFSASINSNSVDLKWQTASELNNLGFEIHRSAENSGWESIGFVQGNGTNAMVNNYSFSDPTKYVNGKYYYRLKQIDNDGSFEFSKIIEVDLGVPLKSELYQNYPNPFNPSTEINYVLTESGPIKIKVFNSIGSEIATLVDGFVNSGKHSINFNAKDLSSGIYFYSIISNNFKSTRKMLLIK